MIGDKRKYNTCIVTLKAKGASGEKPGTDDLDGDALEATERTWLIFPAAEPLQWRRARPILPCGAKMLFSIWPVLGCVGTELYKYMFILQDALRAIKSST